MWPRAWPRGGRVPAGSLTVGGAAAGPVAGAVPHLDPLPPHFQQVRVRQAGFARVPEPLLVVAAVVGDVDGRPGRPGRGLLQLGARRGVAGLVLLQEQGAACARGGVACLQGRSGLRDASRPNTPAGYPAGLTPLSCSVRRLRERATFESEAKGVCVSSPEATVKTRQYT